MPADDATPSHQPRFRRWCDPVVAAVNPTAGFEEASVMVGARNGLRPSRSFGSTLQAGSVKFCNSFDGQAQEIHGRRHVGRHRSGTSGSPVVEFANHGAQIHHSADAKRTSFLTAYGAFDNPWQEESLIARTIIVYRHDALLNQRPGCIPRATHIRTVPQKTQREFFPFPFRICQAGKGGS
ncbi:MAG TPA: hypothetical protein VMV15_12070 [Candidatus Binataceae bacterium]|nr:hypothetical protein [Candidatus Binataceae bacterium]